MSDFNNRYYFAYGSNMDKQQMQFRCPTALFISVAQINGYKFIINSRGIGTIIPEQNSTVFGVLWKISIEDEKSLDNYEGVNWQTYDKLDIEVEKMDGDRIKAFLYIADNRQLGSPQDRYYMLNIIDVAQKYHFPIPYIQELESWLNR